MRLSKEQQRFLCFQYLGGKTMQELASEWDIAIGTVSYIVKKHGIEPEKVKIKRLTKTEDVV